MNCQIDIVIIGDSSDGRETVKKLAASKPSIKIAFISRDFKSATTHDYLNVEYIKDEVIFTDYKNRLFGCYLKSGQRIYCTHLIIATGLAYDPIVINNKQVPCVFNNIDDISKQAKNSQAVVIGKHDIDVKFAIAVAKKYKYVYFCMESFTPDITDKNIKKLINIENLVVLPNATITKFTTTNGCLESIELSNYSTLTCAAVYAKTTSTPETAFVSDKIIGKDEKGYLKVSNLAQSIYVPKCFAIGTCTYRCTQKMKTIMIESILNDFTGGN